MSSFSSDGSIIAIGAVPQWQFNKPNLDFEGYVAIYKYTPTGVTSWTQLGDNIYGEAYKDFSGYEVSLSSDGTRVAIGAQHNDDIGFDMGHVRIFD